MHRLACSLATLAALALPAAAFGEGGVWEAKWEGQSNSLTIESGETAESGFYARNVGTGTWDRSFARLGATNPRERASALYNPFDWLGPTRATALDQATIAPGQIGSFTFVVRAPEVNAVTVTDEYFSPLAEGSAWMENNAANWPLNGVFIRYTLVPRQPPVARIVSSPERVGQGEPLAVTAEAEDNVRINRVAFSVDGRELAVDTEAPYAGSLPTADIPPGRHLLEARAFDGAGQQGTATAAVEVTDSSAGVANGDLPARPARILGGFGRGRSRRTVSYGHAAIVRGHLVGADGHLIKHAVLNVSSRVLVGARGFRDITGARVITGDDGGFAYRVPPGASRQVRLGYRAFSRDAQFAAQRLFTLRSRAGIRLSVAPGRTRNFGRVTFRGRLRGGPKPRAGVLVTLQAREPGGAWRTFRVVRARRGGRFASRYRFTRTGRPTAFRFRAVVRRQIGYPYSTGSSPVRKVFVSG